LRVHELARGLLDFLLPPVCLACDKLIAAGDSCRNVCRRCRALLRVPPAPLCSRCGAPRLRTGRADSTVCGFCETWADSICFARSAFLLQSPADRIVHQLKYRGWQCLAGFAGEAMARSALPLEMTGCDAVVAVPTTKTRVRERGYNQAALIADAFAAVVKIPRRDWLERSASSSSQTTLQPAKRAANVAGAFRLGPGAEEPVYGSRILVVDDVLTTGATVSECAQTLVDAGAAMVCVLTFARALDTQRL
jgi:ComF family protein